MKCLVTGAAGFVGSHLAERLLREQHEVIGIDCFVPYYPRWIKEKNLEGLRSHPQFHFIEANLLDVDLPDLLAQGIECIFHQAAQAGVRASWGMEFADYTSLNILGTQQAPRSRQTSHAAQVRLCLILLSLRRCHDPADA